MKKQAKTILAIAYNNDGLGEKEDVAALITYSDQSISEINLAKTIPQGGNVQIRVPALDKPANQILFWWTEKDNKGKSSRRYNSFFRDSKLVALAWNGVIITWDSTTIKINNNKNTYYGSHGGIGSANKFKKSLKPKIIKGK